MKEETYKHAARLRSEEFSLKDLDRLLESVMAMPLRKPPDLFVVELNGLRFPGAYLNRDAAITIRNFIATRLPEIQKEFDAI